MASILRSGGFLRLFSGFKHALSPNYSRYDITRLHKLQSTQLPVNLSVVRSFAAQKPLENVNISQNLVPNLDKALYRIDGEIRRTGRVSKKDIEDIYGDLKYIKTASSTQSLLLIRCCGSLIPEELPEVRNKLVQDIWDTLIKFNIPLDISHYNALLKVYLENEHQFSPTEFLATLEQNGIEPNRVTYQRLISRYCSDGDIDGATKILEFMKEKELPVNEHVFNALIMGHSRSNDMESAQAVLGVMKGAGLEPSSESYTMLLVAYAEKGDANGLEKALNDCEAADIMLYNREYMEVILALASNGYPQHVSKILEKLQKVQGYQQDTMNLIYRLLNNSCDEVAYQMFETLSQPQNEDGDGAPVGTFFINQLIKSGKFSVPTIVEYCQRMKREGYNMYALQRALRLALVVEQPELALALSKVLLEDGAPLRNHYFWPIMVHYASQGNHQMLYNTVKEMVSMDVFISLETFRDYIAPNLIGKDQDEDKVIAALKESGMNLAAIVNGCISYYISKNDVISAAHLLSRYRFRVTTSLRRDLADAYIKTKEATATAVVLGQMIKLETQKIEGLEDNVETKEETPEMEINSNKDTAGLFLIDVIIKCRSNNRLPILMPLLEAMKSKGICIGNDTSKTIQSRMGEHLNDEFMKLLGDLSLGNLTFQPIRYEDRKPLNVQSTKELEQRVQELENKNRTATNVLSQLLTNYAREKDIEKAEAVRQKLDAEAFPLTNGQYALLIDMYCIDNQLEKALNLYKEFKKREPETKINPTKIYRLASLMIQEGLIEEVIDLLKENAPTTENGDKDDPSNIYSCAKLLTTVAEKCDEVQLNRFFDLILSLEYCKPSPIICRPMVNVHLSKGDHMAALNAFEKLSKEYNNTPLKHELTLAFIKIEDTEKLQKIMDLSIEVHGEMNSLYDLVFAFVECGKIRQAKKILETPGLRARQQKLEQRCQRFLEEKRYTELEQLVAITKDVFDINRNGMFMYLLRAYIQQKDCDKALGIWTSMQEEDIEPNEQFLSELGNFLKQNGRNVPFVMPAKKSIESKPLKEAGSSDSSKEENIKRNFNKAIKEKDLDTALKMKQQIEASGRWLSVTEASHLIESLVQESKSAEAAKVAREMVTRGFFPLPRILKFLLKNLIKHKDVDTMIFLENHLDVSVKKKVSFNNLLCNAYMECGRTEEFLDSLEKSITPDANVDDLKRQFPAGGILGILQRQEDLLPKVKALAEKYATVGILTPMNCMWSHLFCNEAHEEAHQVYDKHLKSSNDMLWFKNICIKARETGKPDQLPSLLEILKSTPTTTASAKGIVYSCWVDILCGNKEYDQALGVLEASLKDIGIENYNNTALVRMKTGLSSINKTFPYAIPERTKKSKPGSSSSSSSSSDSD